VKTLPSNISGSHLKRGARPRIFVELPDMGLFLGTAESTIDGNSYENRLNPCGTITWDAPLFGGMGSISNVTIKNLELDRDVSFCTAAEIDPYGQSGRIGAGRVVSDGYDTYANIRKAATGNFDTVSMICGRRRYGEEPLYGYSVYRAIVQFEIPSDLTSCEDAAIYLTGMANYSDDDFWLYVVEGNWALYNTGDMFNDFQGWTDTEGAYGSTTVLNEKFTSYAFSASGTNIIRLNGDGRNLIESKAGQVLKLMLLSKNDYLGNTTGDPTGDEYVKFEANTAQLKLRYNTRSLTNTAARVYLAYDPVPSSTGDMLLVWTGVVDKWKLNDKTLDLELKQDNKRQDKLLPEKIIDDSSFAEVPQDNVGEPYPLVVGDVYKSTYGLHRCGIGLEKTGGVLNPTSGVHDYYSCPVTKRGDNDYNDMMEILVSNRGIYDSLSAFPAVWISGLKAFGRFWANISSDLGSSYRYVKAYPKKRYHGSKVSETAAVFEEDFLGAAVSIIPSHVYDSDGVTGAENAFSESGSGSAELDMGSDYFVVGFSGRGGGGAIDKAEIVYEQTDAGSTYALGIYVYEKPKQLDAEGDDGVSSYSAPDQYFTSSSATFVTDGVSAGDMLIIESETNRGRYRIKSVDGETQLTLYDGLVDATGQSFKVIASPSNLLVKNEQMTGDGQRVFDITDHVGWDVENILVKFQPTGNQTFTVSNLQLRFFVSPEENITTVYFDKRGMKDDASGTITGSAGSLLENPSHVIEGIARNDMGYGSSYIDADAFDESTGLLSGWEFAFQLTERKGSMKLFDELGRQCKSTVMFDERNRLSILTFNEDRGFPNAGTNTPEVPDDLDIFDEDATATNGEFTRHPISQMSFNVEPLDLVEIKNDFTLYYKMNYGSGEYEKVLFIDHGDGVKDDVETNINKGYLENDQTLEGTGGLKELTSECYNTIGTTNTMVVKCPAIRDEATATKLLQYHVERRTKQRYVVSFWNPGTAVGFEIGDYINIRHTRLRNLLGEAAMYSQKWEIKMIRYDLDKHRIFIKALQV